MDGFFSEDSVFIQMISRISDIVILNLVFLITCIPVVTIGAAWTALNYTAMNAVQNDDGYIAKRYWKAFKENFKQSTVVWLIMLLVGFVLSVDVYFWVNYWKAEQLPYVPVLIILSVFMLFVYLMILMWVFPIMAKFKNTTGKYIWNALALAINHFPWTIVMMIVAVAVLFLCYFYFYMTVFMIVCGFGLLAFGYAFVFLFMFKKHMPEEEQSSVEPDDIEEDDTMTEEDTTEDVADDVVEEVPDTEDADSEETSAAGTVKRQGRTVKYVNSYNGEDEEETE